MDRQIIDQADDTQALENSLTELSQLIGKNILLAMNARGFSGRDLIEKYGFQSALLAKISKGAKFSCTISTLHKLSFYLGYPLYDLFNPNFDPLSKLPAGFTKVEVIATTVQAIELEHLTQVNKDKIKKIRSKLLL